MHDPLRSSLAISLSLLFDGLACGVSLVCEPFWLRDIFFSLCSYFNTRRLPFNACFGFSRFGMSKILVRNQLIIFFTWGSYTLGWVLLSCAGTQGTFFSAQLCWDTGDLFLLPSALFQLLLGQVGSNVNQNVNKFGLFRHRPVLLFQNRLFIGLSNSFLNHVFLPYILNTLSLVISLSSTFY